LIPTRTLGKILKRKKGATGLDLEAIAHLWTEEKPDSEPTADRPIWEHFDINGFYDVNIRPHAKSLGDTRPVIFEILNLLDTHGDVSSGTSGEPVIYNEISLLDHTLLVTKNILNKIKYHHSTLPEIIGRYLIIGLGNSVGLLTKDSDDIDIGDLVLKTLIIIDPIISGLLDKETICRAIKEGFSENKPRTEEGMVLKTSIIAARKTERETAVALAKVWGAKVSEHDIVDAIKRDFPNV